MRQMQKTKQTTKRTEAEVIDLPTASASDTSEAAELVAAIDELIGE